MLDLEKHLKRPEGPGLEGGLVTEPLSRLFLLVILQLLFSVQKALVTQSQRIYPLLGCLGTHREEKTGQNCLLLNLIHSYIQLITLLFNEYLSSA